MRVVSVANGLPDGPVTLPSVYVVMVVVVGGLESVGGGRPVVACWPFRGTSGRALPGYGLATVRALVRLRHGHGLWHWLAHGLVTARPRHSSVI